MTNRVSDHVKLVDYKKVQNAAIEVTGPKILEDFTIRMHQD